MKFNAITAKAYHYAIGNTCLKTTILENILYKIIGTKFNTIGNKPFKINGTVPIL